MYTIPRHDLWYPDVASMRVKRNTNVDFIPSLGITYGTLTSPQWEALAGVTAGLGKLSSVYLLV